MMHASLRDKTAIVGVGTTEFGPRYRNLDPELSPYELAAEALQNALDDAGLSKDDVDGLVAARLPSYARMADVFGIRRPRILNAFQGSGRMSGVVLETAVMAVATGLANVVACVYGNNGRSVGARYGGDIESGPGSTSIYDTMYGMTSPGAYVSLMYRRYQHLYGVPDRRQIRSGATCRRAGFARPRSTGRTGPAGRAHRCAQSGHHRGVDQPIRRQ